MKRQPAILFPLTLEFLTFFAFSYNLQGTSDRKGCHIETVTLAGAPRLHAAKDSTSRRAVAN